MEGGSSVRQRAGIEGSRNCERRFGLTRLQISAIHAQSPIIALNSNHDAHVQNPDLFNNDATLNETVMIEYFHEGLHFFSGISCCCSESRVGSHERHMVYMTRARVSG